MAMVIALRCLYSHRTELSENFYPARSPIKGEKEKDRERESEQMKLLRCLLSDALNVEKRKRERARVVGTRKSYIRSR